jgi:hypothetical protein
LKTTPLLLSHRQSVERGDNYVSQRKWESIPLDQRQAELQIPRRAQEIKRGTELIQTTKAKQPVTDNAPRSEKQASKR